MEFFETRFEKTLNEMNIPLISIIVPVYNTAPWLARCLDSICAQSYSNLEILCVNDGSIDNSAEILAEYAARDSRIKVFTQKNAGLSAARNTALEHATGEWVTGVDSDDYLLPDAYEKALAGAKDEVDLIFYGVCYVKESDNSIIPNSYFNLPSAGEYKMSPELAVKLNVCFWSKLWRRNVIEDNHLRFPVGLVHEDEAMYYLACPYVRKIAICSFTGYCYMQRQGSIMQESVIDVVKIVKRCVSILEFVHSIYRKNGSLYTESKEYLKFMFIQICSSRYWSVPMEQRDEIRAVLASVICKCDMMGQDYRLDRFVSFEQRGLLSITRRDSLVLYRVFGIPIWVKWYTHNGQKRTLGMLLSSIKKRLLCIVKKNRKND